MKRHEADEKLFIAAGDLWRTMATAKIGGVLIEPMIGISRVIDKIREADKGEGSFVTLYEELYHRCGVLDAMIRRHPENLLDASEVGAARNPVVQAMCDVHEAGDKPRVCHQHYWREVGSAPGVVVLQCSTCAALDKTVVPGAGAFLNRAGMADPSGRVTP